MAVANIREWAARFAGRTPAPHTTVATGAAAAANINVTGINVEDFIESVLLIDTTWVDLTAEASITSDGHIQCSTTTSAGKQVLVKWWGKTNR